MSHRGRSRVDDSDVYFREDIRREDYSRDGRARSTVRVRERDEDVDVYASRRRASSRPANDRIPDFLREDYRRSDGELVLRKREVEEISRPAPPPVEERIRSSTRIVERRDPSPSPQRETERVRIVERRRSSPPPPPAEVVRTRVVERRRPPSPPEEEIVRTRVVERERRRSPSPPQEEIVRTRVVERERRRSPSPPQEEIVRTRVVERERRRSPSPPEEEIVRTRVVERERRITPSPHPVERVRTRYVERVRSPSPSLSSSPSPPPPPPVIHAPPIHQEVITHHRHIDHGYELAKVPTPPPRPRSRSRTRREETDINISHRRGETDIDIREVDKVDKVSTYDDDIVYERDERRLRADKGRRRSLSSRRGRDEAEADYYAKVAGERAYIGEAYHGATKDWAIVDVPPGTERVRMDGVGGGSQEITWQKYNGVRRSTFVPERDHDFEIIEKDREIVERGPRESTVIEYEREEVRDREISRPRRPPEEMWTEVTKDLVVRQAIIEKGYEFQEVDDFYYIMEYLRYDDVLELVKLSDEIRHDRRERAREIQLEREALDRRELRERREAARYDDERIIEREVIYDNPRPRRYLR